MRELDTQIMKSQPMVSYTAGSMNSLVHKLTKLKNRPLAIQELLQDLVKLQGDFFHKVCRRRETNLQVEAWMKLVREMVFDIEDWIDQKPDMGGQQLEIEDEIKNFIARVKHAGELCQRYDLVVEGPTVIHDHFAVPSEATVNRRLRFKEKTDLVGLEDQTNELVRLLEGEQKMLKVVSVVGMEGLGKTTLAKEIYTKLQGKFDCHAFVSVGRGPSLCMRAILMDILYQVKSSHQMKAKPKTNNHRGGRREAKYLQKVITDLWEFLSKKRYFILVDGLWSTRAWSIINCALPNENRSRVLITTCISDVAKCCSVCPTDIYQMEALNEKMSRRLYQERTRKDPWAHYWDEATQNMLKICGGIPLAIIVTAGLLAMKSEETIQLNMYGECILSSAEHCSTSKGMMKILQMSYDALSLPLKSCFLYLSVFREDYTIKKDRLIRLWIAEELIPREYKERRGEGRSDKETRGEETRHGETRDGEIIRGEETRNEETMDGNRSDGGTTRGEGLIPRKHKETLDEEKRGFIPRRYIKTRGDEIMEEETERGEKTKDEEIRGEGTRHDERTDEKTRGAKTRVEETTRDKNRRGEETSMHETEGEKTTIGEEKKDEESLWVTGERYFNELIMRRLIQPVFDYNDDQPVGCTVHGVIFDFIKCLSSKGNFVTAGADLSSGSSIDTVRRLTLDSYNDEERDGTFASIAVHLSRVRSVTIFGHIEGMDALPSFKLVRVLDLEDTDHLKSRHLQGIGGLVLLKYLGIAGTYIDTLPEEIGELEQLETLDLRHTKLSTLPASIVKQKRLAHLLIDGTVDLPTEIQNMQGLEEISTIGVGSWSSIRPVVELVSYSECLRVLGIRLDVFHFTCLEGILEMVATTKLTSLLLDCHYRYFYGLWKEFRLFDQLQRFELKISVPIPSTVAYYVNQIVNVTHIDIEVVELDDRFFTLLGKSLNLVLLKLVSRGVINSQSKKGTNRRCTVGMDHGFYRLKVFSFTCQSGGMQLQFTPGAMQELQRLSLGFSARKTLSIYGNFSFGIEHLPSLTGVQATIDCKSATVSEVKDAEDAIRKKETNFFSKPTIEFTRTHQEYMLPDHKAKATTSSKSRISKFFPISTKLKKLCRNPMI